MMWFGRVQRCCSGAGARDLRLFTTHSPPTYPHCSCLSFFPAHADKKIFEQAYSASFGPAMDICYEVCVPLCCSTAFTSQMSLQAPLSIVAAGPKPGTGQHAACQPAGRSCTKMAAAPSCARQHVFRFLLPSFLFLTCFTNVRLYSQIYEDVACGNEIKSVVNAVERFGRWPMGKIDQTHMWQVRAAQAGGAGGGSAGLKPWLVWHFALLHLGFLDVCVPLYAASTKLRCLVSHVRLPPSHQLPPPF